MHRHSPPPATSLDRRRRSTASTDSLNYDIPVKALTSEPRRMGLACASCRRRKIRCDGKQPSCTNCARQGKEECVYVPVSFEENQAVKERKQLAKLRKDKVRAGEFVESTSSRPTRSPRLARSRKASTSTSEDRLPVRRKSSSPPVGKDDEAKPALSNETTLSIKRRWSKTIRFDPLSFGPASSSVGSPLSCGSSRVGNSATTPGLAAATLALQISGPSTAPALTTARTSYFPAYSTSPLQHSIPLEEEQPALPSPPRATYQPTPEPPARPLPLPSPRSICTFPLLEAPEYPLTPPTETSYLSPPAATGLQLSGIEQEPWLDLSHSGTAYRRTTLAHSRSVGHLPQYSAPTPDWHLYHAIPSPSGISPAAISLPPAKHYEQVSPSYSSSPALVRQPVLSLSIPSEPAYTTSRYFLPVETLTPVSTHEPTLALGLQLMHPTQDAPLALSYTATTSTFGPSPPVTTFEETASEADAWTEAWVEEQNRHRGAEQYSAHPVW
ncbi:hypothetical protein JCM8547_008513 [Rhodosporidiobolus lusitaniae]